MFKLYATSFFLAFLASETYSTGIPQSPLSTFQSSDETETFFTSIGYLIKPGEYTQKLIIAPDTCSIRIDFNNFTFDQPIKTPDTSAFVCGPDLNVLKLEAVGPSAINIPDLCGVLSGQHLYLPTRNYKEKVLDTTVLNALKLTVVYLGSDALTSQVPLWNITLTQLPCQSEKDVELSQLSDKLPPIECLQYYTEPEGTIESFNLGHNLGNLYYAICFKLHPETCGIKVLEVNANIATEIQSIDQVCDTLDLTGYAGISRDFFLLPAGVSLNGGLRIFPSKYCGIYTTKTFDIKVTGPGPYYVGVITAGLGELVNLDVGFKIKYKLLTNCQ